MCILALLLEALQILQENTLTTLKPNTTSQVEGCDKASPKHETIYVVSSHSMRVSQTTSFS